MGFGRGSTVAGQPFCSGLIRSVTAAGHASLDAFRFVFRRTHSVCDIDATDALFFLSVRYEMRARDRNGPGTMAPVTWATSTMVGNARVKGRDTGTA